MWKSPSGALTNRGSPVTAPVPVMPSAVLFQNRVWSGISTPESETSVASACPATRLSVIVIVAKKLASTPVVAPLPMIVLWLRVVTAGRVLLPCASTAYSVPDPATRMLLARVLSSGVPPKMRTTRSSAPATTRLWLKVPLK